MSTSHLGQTSALSDVMGQQEACLLANQRATLLRFAYVCCWPLPVVFLPRVLASGLFGTRSAGWRLCCWRTLSRTTRRASPTRWRRGCRRASERCCCGGAGMLRCVVWLKLAPCLHATALAVCMLKDQATLHQQSLQAPATRAAPPAAEEWLSRWEWTTMRTARPAAPSATPSSTCGEHRYPSS